MEDVSTQTTLSLSIFVGALTAFCVCSNSGLTINTILSFKNFYYNYNKFLISGKILKLDIFYKLLEEEKITEINPVGEAFDPETSEAIMAIEGEGESGTVSEVYLKGYMREGKVLRFAQVVVIK